MFVYKIHKNINIYTIQIYVCILIVYNCTYTNKYIYIFKYIYKNTYIDYFKNKIKNTNINLIIL